MMNPDNWSSSVTVSEWYFKPRDDSHGAHDRSGTLKSNTKKSHSDSTAAASAVAVVTLPGGSNGNNMGVAGVAGRPENMDQSAGKE